MPASEPKSASPKKLSGIFISYRRSDTPDAVGRIYDRLVSEFGKARVFKDVDSIPLGQDFRSHLNDIVGGCAAVLAIVGPRWIDTRNAAGQRRLEDPDDFVRIELEAALSRNVPVVPVLVGHAPIPGSSELPTSLASMAFRQSIEVRPDPDFHNDATRLVSALRAIIDPNAPQLVTSSGANAKSTRPLNWMIAFAAAALAAITLAFPALKNLRETPLLETRVDIVTPATDAPGSFALSPDGRQIVFTARDENGSRLWLRSMTATKALSLPGTENGRAPFWSPDGRSIGFFAENELRRLDLGGGRAQTLTLSNVGATGTWGTDAVIVFSAGARGPLLRIAATGGDARQITRLGTESASHQFPVFLPDGRHFVFASQFGTAPGTYLGSLDEKAPVRLSEDQGPIAYLPSGWLLRVAEGALVAQRLDLEKATLSGDPVTLAIGVGAVSAASTGLIAYRGSVDDGVTRLEWMDRSGAALGTIGDPNETYNAPRISPDGRRVVVTGGSIGKRDLWLLDGPRSSRLTFNGSTEGYSVWSPDGTRVAFSSRAVEVVDLYQTLASGGEEAKLLLSAEGIKYASSWSADGRFLLFFSTWQGADLDLWVLPLTGERKPSLIFKSKNNEIWGQFSPDGKWVAYQSNETNRNEVFVRPFIEPGSISATQVAAHGKWQVSTAGGITPMWSANGKELFYINRQGEMMAAALAISGSTLTPDAPIKLFQTRILGGGADIAVGRQYDVAHDGRFLINEVVGDIETLPITLIQNWNPDAGK